MYKKLISSILVVALLNLLGCTSFKSFPVNEFKQIEEGEEKPNEIRVKTNDSQEYRFLDSNFYIKNDTLYGNGTVSVEEMWIERKFSLQKIKSLQYKDTRSGFITPMTLQQLKDIEKAKRLSYEILITTNDASKYRFMKNDYYIKNDTLYGKGKLRLEREEQRDIKIALSDIESIQFEQFDSTKVIFISLKIVLIIVIMGGIFYLGLSAR